MKSRIIYSRCISNIATEWLPQGPQFESAGKRLLNSGIRTQLPYGGFQAISFSVISRISARTFWQYKIFLDQICKKKKLTPPIFFTKNPWVYHAYRNESRHIEWVYHFKPERIVNILFTRAHTVPSCFSWRRVVPAKISCMAKLW